MAWQLAQTFWVGGLWLLQFFFIPSLTKVGLAPLLAVSVAQALTPMMMGFAAFCVLLQALMLTVSAGLASLWREMRGQLLISIFILCVIFFITRAIDPEALRWLHFNYLAVAICGLILVLQPPPGQK